MLFNSAAFLIFYATVVPLYFLTPHRARWALLLAASCFFYAWAVPQYLLLLGSIILIDYAAGLGIEKASGGRRRAYLWLSLAANLGTLFLFKYWDFANGSIASLASCFGVHYEYLIISTVIPVGLSFHTFQAMSYTIEVYHGNQPAERHLGIYALYVMFFPQLVAGPIERPQNLLHQFRERHFLDYDRLRSGIQLIIWGLFKKMVVADTLGRVVNGVYDNPTRATGLTFGIGTVCFAYQIYCDFSGYSDVAIGAAEVLGIKLMANFRRPYHAASLGEFWHRWHISLSTWFRDYVYFPLGGSRNSLSRTCFNLMVVFLLSGIWHGANWTFAVWGLFHGACRVIEMNLERRRPEPADQTETVSDRAMRVMRTFAIVCVGWIFFRANSMSSVFVLFCNSIKGWDALLSTRAFEEDLFNVGVKVGQLGWCCALIGFVEVAQCLQTRGSVRALIDAKPLWMRWGLYYAAAFIIILFGQHGEQKFIYYQF